MHPVLQSITFESYLESVKTKLADIKINKPNNNLSRNEMAALKELKSNSAINLKNADKGTTAVIMNKSNKMQEAEVQLKIREHYKPLQARKVKTTQKGQPDHWETALGQTHRWHDKKNGFLKPSSRLEFRSSTRLQKATNLFRSEDRSSQVVTS